MDINLDSLPYGDIFDDAWLESLPHEYLRALLDEFRYESIRNGRP